MALAAFCKGGEAYIFKMVWTLAVAQYATISSLSSGRRAESPTGEWAWNETDVRNVLRAICLLSGTFAERITGQSAWSSAYLQSISQSHLHEMRHICGMCHRAINLKSDHTRELYHRVICLKHGIFTKRITEPSAWNEGDLRNVSQGNLFKMEALRKHFSEKSLIGGNCFSRRQQWAWNLTFAFS